MLVRIHWDCTKFPMFKENEEYCLFYQAEDRTHAFMGGIPGYWDKSKLDIPTNGKRHNKINKLGLL